MKRKLAIILVILTLLLTACTKEKNIVTDFKKGDYDNAYSLYTDLVLKGKVKDLDKLNDELLTIGKNKIEKLMKEKKYDEVQMHLESMSHFSFLFPFVSETASTVYELKESQEIMDLATSFFNDKEYEVALEYLSSVSENDERNYEKAKTMINQSALNIAKINVENAENTEWEEKREYYYKALDILSEINEEDAKLYAEAQKLYEEIEELLFRELIIALYVSSSAPNPPTGLIERALRIKDVEELRTLKEYYELLAEVTVTKHDQESDMYIIGRHLTLSILDGEDGSAAGSWVRVFRNSFDTELKLWLARSTPDRNGKTDFKEIILSSKGKSFSIPYKEEDRNIEEARGRHFGYFESLFMNAEDYIDGLRDVLQSNDEVEMIFSGDLVKTYPIKERQVENLLKTLKFYELHSIKYDLFQKLYDDWS